MQSYYFYNCRHYYSVDSKTKDVQIRHCVKSVRISPYLVQMRENTGQNNSKYGYFLRSENFLGKKYQQMLIQLITIFKLIQR